ncbi:hypothetical protein CEUSTIGMA_g3524.t1 [Chlamydomonas eustigma]|uniref:Uncharacterized protein n=1 Tax=Chlamydomonas eustigma TaxID=1157962 RepID=A0A250WZ24_9CHLO|nr:hypothetical protein CEUSTIGMA_g3524.t1 [Chlamydomonas eustigma]|eukprot:GAX76081.1 hypothetical protein CEUSTIGMA_g3524.t1 [Chlamydomonas eustigma]
MTKGRTLSINEFYKKTDSLTPLECLPSKPGEKSRINDLNEINVFNHDPVKFKKSAKNPTSHLAGPVALDHSFEDVQRRCHPKDLYRPFQQDQQLHGEYPLYGVRTAYPPPPPPRPPPPRPPPPPRKALAESSATSELVFQKQEQISPNLSGTTLSVDPRKEEGLGQMVSPTLAKLGDRGITKGLRSNLINGGTATVYQGIVPIPTCKQHEEAGVALSSEAKDVYKCAITSAPSNILAELIDNGAKPGSPKSVFIEEASTTTLPARPKLNLLPRTKGITAESSSVSKPSIFGDARPREEVLKERSIHNPAPDITIPKAHITHAFLEHHVSLPGSWASSGISGISSEEMGTDVSWHAAGKQNSSSRSYLTYEANMQVQNRYKVPVLTSSAAPRPPSQLYSSAGFNAMQGHYNCKSSRNGFFEPAHSYGVSGQYNNGGIGSDEDDQMFKRSLPVRHDLV